ncbi:RNA polymerase sigma-H factor [bioreactor metagenome]|uniref:RNA polymerase sigma factor SigS n=2 Tax=root TaxID=1 RepID=A0A562J3G0_9FIRM|nr:sigma-70 family RNA polymerase sigma factor [Sedimentibacter saalensis]TWH77643.1 RNA polymerase sporulation-specific sigma factor [Sedimentibacter saalensis]
MIPVVLFDNYIYNFDDYDNFSDEELVEKRNDGDKYAEECLYKRYTYVVKRITSSFFIIGGGKDDLFQEAMIGLIKAVNSYDGKFGAKFKTYAEVCVRRQVISAIRKTSTHMVKGISLYDYIDSENDSKVFDYYFSSENLNPEIVYINEEEKNLYYEQAKKILSRFEIEVLTEYEEGKSYEEISLVLNKSIKSIDNALQRVKRKICNNKEKMYMIN